LLFYIVHCCIDIEDRSLSGLYFNKIILSYLILSYLIFSYLFWHFMLWETRKGLNGRNLRKRFSDIATYMHSHIQ